MIEKDLLRTRWSKDELMMFFSALPVHEWFNSSAPQVKSGEVNPATCSVEQAVQLMLAEPLLIRRPLMRVDTEVMVGFDQEAVDKWIGLRSKTANDVETCPRRSATDSKVTKIRTTCL